MNRFNWAVAIVVGNLPRNFCMKNYIHILEKNKQIFQNFLGIFQAVEITSIVHVAFVIKDLCNKH